METGTDHKYGFEAVSIWNELLVKLVHQPRFTSQPDEKEKDFPRCRGLVAGTGLL